MKTVRCVVGLLLLAGIVWAARGPEWISLTVGTRHRGHAIINGEEVTVRASGADIWNTSDGMHYVYAPTNGDVTLVARVKDIEGMNEWAKAGWMVRASADSSARFVYVLASARHGILFEWRLKNQIPAVQNGTTTEHTFPNCWIKLVKEGNRFTAFASKDGKEWKQQGTGVTVEMSGDFLIGLAATSRIDGKLATAKFDNLSPKIANLTISPDDESRPVRKPPVRK